MVGHAHEIGGRADFLRDETREFVPFRTASQQIGVAAAQVARTRAAEREHQLTVLDEPVHFVEQRGHLLHFVDDREGATRRVTQFIAQQSRSLGVANELLSQQQINAPRRGIACLQETALADLPRAPEEETVLGGGREAE